MQLHTCYHLLIVMSILAMLSLRLAQSSGNISTSPSTSQDFEDMLAQQLNREDGERRNKKMLLSRKRRYLLFPAGSSFQLVYDGIIGIVDYTNYLILGITVALAWQLPSDPPSEMLESIQQQFDDGTFGLGRNDTITNITYVNTVPKSKVKQAGATKKPNYINLMQPAKQLTAASSYYYTNRRPLQPVFRPPMHKKYYYPRPADNYYRQKYTPNRVRPNAGWRRKDSYYYSTKKPTHPLAIMSKAKGQQRKFYDYMPHVGAQYPWWNLPARLTNAKSNLNAARESAKERQFSSTQQQRVQSASDYYQSHGGMWQHRIYPVFGKRSIPDARAAKATSFNSSDPHRQQQHHHHHRQRRHGIAGLRLNQLERIHIRHHRSTRQTLYGKIEKYLEQLGHSGHHCVLRALCETGQKSEERTPVSFVGELMRAVFTMPEALDNGDGDGVGDLHAQHVPHKELRYDAANAFAGDCASRYQLCKQSLWQADFVA